MDSRRTLGRAALTLAIGMGSFACQESVPGSSAAVLETDGQKASYAIGLDIGGSLVVAEARLDVPALQAGIVDGLAEREPEISDDEIQRVTAIFNEAVMADMQAQARAENAVQAAVNAEEGAAYRAGNAERAGVTVLPSGLQYEIMRDAEGERPGPEDLVLVNYRGTLIDGTEFDSSYARGQPASFSLFGVIDGFAEGIQLMPVGSQYRLVIPPDLGYGPMGSPPTIGPDATLIFEIELLEILDSA